MSEYTVKIYVAHGYFEYNVNDMGSALEHANVIMGSGVYRRVNASKEVEFHPVIKVKVCGDDLGTQYPDTFKRT